jgi:hypothetical protein
MERTNFSFQTLYQYVKPVRYGGMKRRVILQFNCSEEGMEFYTKDQHSIEVSLNTSTNKFHEPRELSSIKLPDLTLILNLVVNTV